MTLPIESVPRFYHANNYTNLSNKIEIFTISLNRLVSVTSEEDDKVQDLHNKRDSTSFIIYNFIKPLYKYCK